jgi:hypothetical protein
VAVLLVWLAQDLSFFYDEWGMILQRDITLDGLLQPWNEHPSVLLVLAWRTLLGLFGTVSYWPFLLLAWLSHAAVVGAVYVITRDRAPAVWATAAALLMAVLGSGSENILWAFQVAPNLSVALGLIAVWIAPRRPGTAAALLTVSTLTQGVGLAFLAGAGLHLLLTRPRSVWWMAVPALLWGAWYVAFGSSVIGSHGWNLLGVPAFVAGGLAYTAAGILGTRELAIGAGAIIGLAVVIVRQRTVDPVHIALIASAVAFFAMTGLVRAQDTIGPALQSRYVYVAAPALLIVAASVLSRIQVQPALRPIFPAILTFALVGNVGLMILGQHARLDRQRCEEAHIPVAERMVTSELRSYPC